jgi:hypothetical protein
VSGAGWLAGSVVPGPQHRPPGDRGSPGRSPAPRPVEPGRRPPEGPGEPRSHPQAESLLTAGGGERAVRLYCCPL